MNLFFFLPIVVFFILFIGELLIPCPLQKQTYHWKDWALNCTGLFIQGALVPLLGLTLGLSIFPLFPILKQGLFPLSWGGSFLLNFIVVDFLYYWQHRLFHQVPFLWKLHVCHHSSPRVDIWATSRNNLWINLIFVYLLVNPLLGYLCQHPEGFWAGACVTASLDIVRHSQLNWNKLPGQKIIAWLGKFFVLPAMHRSHHNMIKTAHNFGANLTIWDKLFGTFISDSHETEVFQPKVLTSYQKQFCYPLIR